MGFNLLYWKTMVLKLLFMMQCLFLVNITWDFFLTTVAVSNRGHILTTLSTTATTMVVVPWIQAIIFLSIMMLLFICSTRLPKIMGVLLNIEYAIVIMVYVILLILSITNPLIHWAVFVNYAANIVWAVSILFFRYLIKHNYTVDRRYDSDALTNDRRVRDTYLKKSETTPLPDIVNVVT